MEPTHPDSTVLASSKHSLPTDRLVGFAFQDADLLIGDVGRVEYAGATGKEIHPGEDGSYVSVVTRGNVATIGTDFAGYQRLLVYRHGPNWALGTSFIDLLEFAAGNNWPVTPDPAQLRVFWMSGSLGGQLVSHSTAVKEIKLLPAAASVTVRSGSARASLRVRLPRPVAPLQRRTTRYARLMEKYTSIWLSRLAVLARSDLQLLSDVSGGRDSRVVLGFLLRASELAGTGGAERFDFRSGLGAADDLKVAKTLDRRFSLNLNTRRITDHRILNGEQAYTNWRQVCLGLYGPVYLSPAIPLNGALFGGAGGESHRMFYTHANMTRHLEHGKRALGGEVPFAAVRDDMLLDLAQLRRGVERTLDERILHYRHFRDRLHGGRLALSQLKISPLAGRHLRDASALASHEHRERSQILADLLLNLNEELALMDYDIESKKLDSRHQAEALDLSSAIKAPLRDGAVFGRVTASESRPATDSALAFFHAAADRSAHTLQGTDWLPEAEIQDAVETAKTAAERGRFDHPVKGKPAATLILAAAIRDAARQ